MKSKMNSLQDLFIHELRDIYDSDRQLVRAQKKLARAAGNDVLRETLDEEKPTDEKLTPIAKSRIHEEAAREEELVATQSDN